LIKLNISHYYRKILEKSRSFLAGLSSSYRIDLPLIMVSLKERLAGMGPSSSHQRFKPRLRKSKKPPPKLTAKQRRAERKAWLKAELKAERKAARKADREKPFRERMEERRKRSYAKRKLFFARMTAHGERVSARLRYFLAGLFAGRKALLAPDGKDEVRARGGQETPGRQAPGQQTPEQFTPGPSTPEQPTPVQRKPEQKKQVQKKSFFARLFAGKKSLLASASKVRRDGKGKPEPAPEFASVQKKQPFARWSLLKSRRPAAEPAQPNVEPGRPLAKQQPAATRTRRPVVESPPQPPRKPRLPLRKKTARVPTVGRPLLRPPSGKRVDAFLFAATLIILVLVTSSYFRRTITATPEAVSIFVSPHYWTMFGNTADMFIMAFEAQNPGYRIVMADRENLDIVFFDDGEFAALVESAALASLSPYIYTEIDEDQWALPLVAFVDLFFYNIDLLQKAGNDRPPRTRDEFIAAARSVAETAAEMQENFYPFALGLSDADPLGVRRDFYPWVWALGGEVHSGFTDDGTLILPAPTTNTINFFAQMNREGLLAPGTFEHTGRDRLRQFAEGRIAMLVASARDILFMRDSPHGVNFDITAVPATAPGRNRLGLSGIYAGISSASTQPDQAWAFLVFIAGQSHLLATAMGAVPGSFFINFPSQYIAEDALYSKAWEIFDAADIVEFQSGDIAEKEAGRVILEMLSQAFAIE